MRQADPPVQYLVGVPKGRLSRLERDLVDKPWREARPGVEVKLCRRTANSTCSPKPRPGRQGARACAGGN